MKTTSQDIVELGKSWGLDFSSDASQEFLNCWDSCDVQAAPGCGKTTLLVAKLALASRKWPHSRRGICVISHTNVARREVESRLAGDPAGRQLLSYPHFIGTVTAFSNQFLSYPYLRGLGWQVHRIDDDYFANAALWFSRTQYPGVAAWMKMKPRDATKIIRELTLSPLDLEVHQVPGMPGAGTKSGKGLRAIKNVLTRAGIFRHDDLIAIAHHAIRNCPGMAKRLADRFPYVFVDEAQDTRPQHLELVDRVFSSRCVLQRLGDCNQTIFAEDAESTMASQWSPRGRVIDLGQSKRFGPAIAMFAETLTVLRPQRIVGEGPKEAGQAIFLFERDTIKDVLPEFVSFIMRRHPQGVPAGYNAWAVGARHRPSKAKTWPNSVGDYWPGYAPPDARQVPASLASALRRSRLLAHEGATMSEALNCFVSAIIELLRRERVKTVEGERWSTQKFWSAIDAAIPSCGAELRKIFIKCVSEESVPFDELRSRILNALNPILHAKALGNEATEFLEADRPTQWNVLDGNVFRIGNVGVKLGSIASVKGQTHDATLVLETSHNKVMDMETVLPVALGRAAPISLAAQEQQRAAINIFVASTRPRDVLCLAIRRSAVDDTLLRAARELGWQVFDLSKQGVNVAEIPPAVRSRSLGTSAAVEP